jgi:serine/threonine protein kinase
MGEVYHATDTRLQRPVAIKVLPEELTASAAARDRLQREARTASVLNHPNICTIYDVGMGVPMFIAMELLQGESLQQRLQRDGRLRVDELLDIAIAIAEGLGAAHWPRAGRKRILGPLTRCSPTRVSRLELLHICRQSSCAARKLMHALTSSRLASCSTR